MSKRKPGRPKSAHPRDNHVATTLTAKELADLDASRGRLSRSAYTRLAIARLVQADATERAIAKLVQQHTAQEGR